MTSLSVNINKVATLRNARGTNTPDLLEVAKDLQRFGAQQFIHAILLVSVVTRVRSSFSTRN